MEEYKLLRNPTDLEREKWLSIRERFINGIKGTGALLKKDMTLAFGLNLVLYGTPRYRPNITCCVERGIWKDIIKNLDNAMLH